MAESKCQNCNSTQFEIQTKEIKKGQDNFEFAFVQCAKCGSVVGVLQTKVVVTSMVNTTNAILDAISNAKFELNKAIHEKKS
ncbi:hypothetical protein [uncultured Bacteroides sp.]|uniref:hypothetical protein n=1 Tax=uncultured Bacteroides sp. TaxID=162156 RepID=UPI0025F27F24|nr:hypothetical protein [uncultured Bacteroides sp.]